jgi:hypothetical protein
MHLQVHYGAMVYNVVQNVLTGITAYGIQLLILKDVHPLALVVGVALISVDTDILAIIIVITMDGVK